MTRFPSLLLGLAVAAGAHAELNLGFETLDGDARPLGWSVVSSGTDVGSDGSAVEGERSLRVTRATPGVARVTQRAAAASLRPAGAAPRAMRLRLTGSARAAAPSVSAALWLRIDGPHGPLFLDSGGFAREPAAEPAAAIPGSPTGSGDWRRFAIELPFPPDTEEIAFGVSLRGQGTAWFDALELKAVATDAWPPASAAAVRYLDAALALMREHSLRRADVDWPALRTQALEHARGAVAPSEAHLAVRFAVRELGDRHSYLQSAAATQALATTAVANARTGSPLTAPHGQRLGTLGYLNVPGFAGGTPLKQVEFAEQVKNIIQATEEAGVCGWVVDLRQNTGGNLWPMLAGLGPLLGDGELAASVYPDGRRVPVWYRDGQAGFGDYTQLRVRSPYRPSGVRPPVAVLLGPATASSAEVLAVAFGGRPATRSFGAPTRGLSAGNRTFALADGASLVLTVAATTDGAGRAYTGPIVPDEPVARTDQPSGAEASADAVLAAAAAWLGAGDSCR